MNQQSDHSRHRQEIEDRPDLSCRPDAAARMHLTLGCVHEHEANWEAAIASYRQVLAYDPQDPAVNYFGNNNLAYSLIQMGCFDEAEDYCLAAIDVDVRRHNAHKNLGLVFQGQGRWLDAAHSFLTAHNLNPQDPRALHHLEQLVTARPMLLTQSDSLRAGVKSMRNAIVEGDCAVMQ
jgi:tetratricopeptide (TPR) repeat protein